MEQIYLCGRETSRIGLGCGRLFGGRGEKASRKIVETARELGITHFDVAPSYGLGLAENVLGVAIGNDPEVTIATKVGIGRPSNSHMKTLVRQLSKPMLARLPTLKRSLGRAAQNTAPRGLFSREEIEISVRESLLRLRRDSVDVLLLHEPIESDITAELSAQMHRFVDDGLAKLIGSSTAAGLESLVHFGDLYQYGWRAKSPVEDGSSNPVVVHGVLRRYAASAVLTSHQVQILRLWDRDPKDPAAWPAFVLTLALATTPTGIILVSSNEPSRLASAVNGIDWSAAEFPDVSKLAETMLRSRKIGLED